KFAKATRFCLTGRREVPQGRVFQAELHCRVREAWGHVDTTDTKSAIRDEKDVTAKYFAPESITTDLIAFIELFRSICWMTSRMMTKSKGLMVGSQVVYQCGIGHVTTSQ
ncbi:hypothetical protein NGA_0470600, partial [Nannochloropsis gaditana CCMP526]|uniref:uncharacterized protein n=1 Tax=Nannochloropsis gaditana (strain CCMP526) TaxID=1093141 RepID=UPI00029F5EF3